LELASRFDHLPHKKNTREPIEYVIPTGAQRSGGICCFSGSHRNQILKRPALKERNFRHA
jgi:hypothetical protein